MPAHCKSDDAAPAHQLQCNPCDRFGYVFRGFVPGLAAREVRIRGGYWLDRKMLLFLVICFVLAIRAIYELIEWAATIALGQGADDFLGTQGDSWDPQSDRLFALAWRDGLSATVAAVA